MSINKKFKKLIIITSIIFIIFITFFCVTKSKKIKIGNTNNSQEIIENILNISSYESIIEVEINSNKNVNKYVIKQNYKAQNTSEQEVLAPENIRGIKIKKTENELKVENTNLNISKIYNNYQYITNNYMDLNTFIEIYKQDKKQEYEENDNEIILKTENVQNPYVKHIKLYISKETGKPTKMEVKNNSKKTLIYILYKEVKFK